MFYIFIFLFGLVIGSFLHVVILRLRSGEPIAWSRSRCPHCREELRANELIPLVSFMVQRGRCRHCREKISWQYPLVELCTGLLFILITYRLAAGYSPLVILGNWETLVYWLRNVIFVCVLIVIFVYDLRWSLILDKVTIPAMAVALVINLYLGLDWRLLLLGGLIGLAFFALQFIISKGKWLGGGDLRLGLLMGLMLGWPQVLAAILLAYVIGALTAIPLLIMKKKNMNSEIALGTFLTLGTLIMLLWGKEIIGWYVSLLG